MSEPRIGPDNGRGAEGPPTLSVDESEEIDRLCDRFEAAWRAGARPRFEDHLSSFVGPFRAALKAELIAIELEWRRRGEGLRPRADRAGEAAGHLPPGPGALETLARSVGAVPRVLLRDTDGGPEPPLHRPAGGEAGQGTRYRIDGEIARGGMGAVLRGRDPDLGREVALKVLREDFRDDVDMVRRFVEEAQIGGQLQHPGIVPIYEMGTLEDHRPFFSMKLVKGDTLAGLLAARGGPRDELPRLLAIFEAIARTVAYAHARGVIHRDLKPSNVMVGAFGEVQVMDWGLAKVLARGGAADDAEAGKLHHEETVIATARSGSADSGLSRAGSVLGTPSYMAPEQARGEIEHVDERADVFALGSILCEILTDQPAFVGVNSGEIQRTAAVGETAGALARLDACGADAELVRLAKDCLAREAQDRPARAGAVSGRVTAYLAGVQDRLRRAELERVEERARRRLTMIAAASAIVLGLIGGGAYVWNQRQRADRVARTALAVNEALADAARLRGEALAAPPDDAGRWSAALAAARQAEGLLAQGEAGAALQGRVAALMAGVERDRAAAGARARRIEIDRALLADLETVRGTRVEFRGLNRSDAEYADAFRKAGLDLDTASPEKAGRWLTARTEPVEIVGYLDDWAFVRRAIGRPDADMRRLVAAARRGDPNPWRDAIRARLGSDDARTVAEFRRMADDANLEDQPAAGLLLLARQLKFGCGDGARAARVLRRAALRHPGDFRIHLELAFASGPTLRAGLSVLDLFPDPEEASRHLTAALAIRPGSVSTRLILSAVQRARKLEEAVALTREAVRLKPDDATARSYHGNNLRWRWDFDAAEAECREAVRLKPTDGNAHATLGQVLVDQERWLRREGKYDEGIAEFREAVRLDPEDYWLYVNTAEYLQRKGDYAGARDIVLKAREKGLKVLPDPWHSAEWLARIGPMAALEARLPAILKGEDRPKNVAERLDLAQISYHKKWYAASARFWSEALETGPKLGDDRTAQHRYNAACSAALAGAGQDRSDAPPNNAARSALRGRALAWLKAELTAWSRTVETGKPTDRTKVVSVLRHWLRDADLAAVRDADALAKLPETERKD